MQTGGCTQSALPLSGAAGKAEASDKVRRGRFSLENGGFRLRRGPDKCLFSESGGSQGLQPRPEGLHGPPIFPTKAQGGPLWGRKAPAPGQTPLSPPHPPATSPHQALQAVLPHPLCLLPDAFSGDHRYANRKRTQIENGKRGSLWVMKCMYACP